MSDKINLNVKPKLLTDVDENVDSISTDGAQLMSVHIQNKDAAIRYVQVFNAASTNVTLGTTVPVLSLPVPASGFASYDFQSSGVSFPVGLSIACTDDETGNTGATSGATVNLTYVSL